MQRNETDAADAQAIGTAGQQPGLKFVAVKNDAQQVVLALHRLRAQLMKMRICELGSGYCRGKLNSEKAIHGARIYQGQELRRKDG